MTKETKPTPMTSPVENTDRRIANTKKTPKSKSPASPDPGSEKGSKRSKVKAKATPKVIQAEEKLDDDTPEELTATRCVMCMNHFELFFGTH